MSEAGSQDEGVLREILEELDKERSKRAELEAKIRRLEYELAKKKKDEEQKVSKRSFIAMEAQVAGYQDIIEALTSSRPAITAIANSRSSQQNLPLHVVRLLETIPWDERSREYITREENIYEWQVYEPRDKRWQSQLKHFPPFFKSLPRARLGGRDKDDRSLLIFLAGGVENLTGSGKVVLTDEFISKCLDGVPELPKVGVWQWVSGWRVNSRVLHHLTEKAYDSDKDGWSYVALPQNFLLDNPDLVYSDAGGSDEVERKIRRRCWSRQRILVEYPFICDSTRHYLSILAENARLKVTSNKVSEQLVETKVALTESEEQLVRSKEQLLRNEMTTQQLQSSEHSSITHNSLSDSKATENLDNRTVQTSNSQVKEIGSKISSWVNARKHAKAGSSSSIQFGGDLAADGKSVGGDQKVTEPSAVFDATKATSSELSSNESKPTAVDAS